MTATRGKTRIRTIHALRNHRKLRLRPPPRPHSSPSTPNRTCLQAGFGWLFFLCAFRGPQISQKLSNAVATICPASRAFPFADTSSPSLPGTMGGRTGSKRGEQVNVPILRRSQAIRGSPFLPQYTARLAMQGGRALPNVSSPGYTHGDDSRTHSNGSLPALPATHAESWCARSGVSWATLGARRPPGAPPAQTRRDAPPTAGSGLGTSTSRLLHIGSHCTS